MSLAKDKTKKLILLATIFFLIHNTPIGKVEAAGPIVWLEDGMTRVLKNSPVKSDTTITLYTAKNEYEAFQIIVKAPAGNGLTNVNVSISNLTGPNGAVLSSGNLTLYREHYLNVSQGSKHHNGETNAPLGPGWYPDALIPFKDPATNQDLSGQLDAVPFTILAGIDQPIWVDIFTPANTPAGLYQGTATVSTAQGSATVNINLNVWNFQLPKTRSLKGQTHIWTSTYKNRTTDIELIKHRFNPKTVKITDERFLIDNYGLDEINIFAASGATYNNCSARPPPLVSDVIAEVARHQKDLYFFDSYANEVWNCTSQFSTFLQWAANLRAGGIQPEIVTYPVDALMGTDLDHTAADIWYFLPKHYDLAKTNINKLINHQGTQVRSYNPLVQDGYSPKFPIDFSPINARIMQGFINQSLGLTGTKFWRVDNWTADPWNNPNLLSQGGVPVPGEGAMVYPGDKVGLLGQVVSGVRMKWFREGSEDFEYIEMLKNQGQEGFALSIAQGVGSDFHTWTKNKDVLLSARKTLGEKLHSLAGTSTPTPTPTGSPTAAKLRFKILMPDVLPSTTGIASSNVVVEARDGSTTVATTNVALTRNGNYYQTSSDALLNIPSPKAYTIFIKSKISIGKLFNNVTLTPQQILDCTQIVNLLCGELISQKDSKPLVSGDTDGFAQSSGSYNKIDSADLQILASQFNTSPPTAGPSSDFNLDSQINILDLEILGKNYGGVGD
ncbi:hypothetical protein A3B40_01195 [Candidatus Roizmanbacteria bacterium RIFCSPLOWO2_01_FULL_37_16]|uniref:Glycoside hydrolase 123 N-terminal domain-containing protein n=1 Tax=Candidatus Roizmanbacteria bacterium RIFCSPLOWO2_01_FULL_37_16 TaxID=1802058 RepID=A0A1F7IQC3_9BACT|nr:MAG: hypothetical protein A2859_00565 [Candidatus Roizmanbacteria bacterium RIFCSPHIGHO2_01_FULL_37_16b]OGK31716.1 MAG: hypothetical protein A3F57_03950 [Candidatus Roizmanbacteria bacterium RIFCSPHIGHO2_12_FULL_36_11]OGK45568.1 MAG: hypothetical protein A3B40_01195 [Candidatus Roizmanbacteria bacterium RIFCSPLOWO2_01_FULL_37_16]